MPPKTGNLPPFKYILAGSVYGMIPEFIQCAGSIHGDLMAWATYYLAVALCAAALSFPPSLPYLLQFF
jgi:hypothetical protein